MWGKYSKEREKIPPIQLCGEGGKDVKKSRDGMVLEQGAQGGCKSSEALGSPRTVVLYLLRAPKSKWLPRRSLRQTQRDFGVKAWYVGTESSCALERHGSGRKPCQTTGGWGGGGVSSEAWGPLK